MKKEEEHKSDKNEETEQKFVMGRDELRSQVRHLPVTSSNYEADAVANEHAVPRCM